MSDDHDHDHEHGNCGCHGGSYDHDHDHHHGHGHGENPAVAVANQIIDFANKALEVGLTPDQVADGMRHAAANFSAFAFYRTESGPQDPNALVDHFQSYLEHYLPRHKPQEPAPGLASIIQRAKNDF